MATNEVGNKEMQSFAARYNSFHTAHQLSKRRASSQAAGSKKKGGNTVEWPHERPSGEDLARAGFFYRPAQDSHDNVQCFLCSVKLDGWEPEDDPIKEHLAHSKSCAWALSWQAGFAARQEGGDGLRDPMSEELVAARKGTFEVGSGWPHEGKRGWKCKVSKMVEAGWCLDPAPSSSAEGAEEAEEADGVTCFYCELSLDGWEPKDDPLTEHKRRSPNCAFFALAEKFGSGAEKKGAKGRGKKGGARASTASKASRLSTQSALSAFSQEPSLADVDAGLEVEADAEGTAVDDSIMSTASQATATGTIKGKKKPGRPKAAAKGAKGRKRANTVDSQADVEPKDQQTQDEETIVSQDAQEEQLAPAPAKKGRKAARPSKQQQVDSSIIEVNTLDAPAPAKKAIRGRKPKAQPHPEVEVETEADNSDVSQQLQDELERSMSIDPQVELDDATPQPEVVKPKRGVKRTSDGLKKKQQDESDVSVLVVEFPVPPKAAAPAKAKRGRQASKQIAAAEDSQPEKASQPPLSQPDDAQTSEVEEDAPKQAKAKKAPATKGRGKGRKASSTRSSRSSKATVITAEPEQPTGFEQEEDLERDEREIEAELERMAAEQSALQAEHEKSAEFEPSPSHKQQVDRQTNSNRPGAALKASPPPQLPPLNLSSKNATPSPTGSDKENQPSSAFAPSTTKKQPLFSPTKTTRIPLAPGTPNRILLSPSKRSPLKNQQISHLTSTHPWHAMELDGILLAEPQPTPNMLASRLAGAAGVLAETEKALTVEGWVRLQAERAEEELRRRCEEMVGVFEREGVRALGSLEGVVVSG